MCLLSYVALCRESALILQCFFLSLCIRLGLADFGTKFRTKERRGRL